ncbi:unnamed protein product [Coregonus sp. 'balchen']|nr:unnamed protein product [Coregonus sp. 'balchen']
MTDHVVGHVVEEAIRGGQDDVTQLDVEGGAVSGLRAGEENTGLSVRTSQRALESCYQTDSTSAPHKQKYDQEEAGLPHPKEDSRNQKGQGQHSDLSPHLRHSNSRCPGHTTGLSSPLPAYDHQSQDHSTISLLKDGLALLEVWVTELKEQPPSYTTSSPDTELLYDQIYQCRTQLKNSVQELREGLTTALQEVKATMRREPHHRASGGKGHHEERAGAGPTHHQSITTPIGLARLDQAQPTTPHQTTTSTRPERKPHGPDLAPLHSTGPNSRTSAATRRLLGVKRPSFTSRSHVLIRVAENWDGSTP